MFTGAPTGASSSSALSSTDATGSSAYSGNARPGFSGDSIATIEHAHAPAPAGAVASAESAASAQAPVAGAVSAAAQPVGANGRRLRAAA